MGAPKKRKFLFAAHKCDSHLFEMADDGRKTKHASGCRRTLFMELASFADADGRGAWPSYKTLAKRLGYSESKIKRYITDLTKLGFCVTRGKSKFGGTVIRDLNLPAIGSDTLAPIGSDTNQSGHIGLLSGHSCDPPIGSSNDLQPALDLPTNVSAHLPILGKVVEGLQKTFGQVKGGDILSVTEMEKSKLTQIMAQYGKSGTGEVTTDTRMNHVFKTWLSERNLTGLTFIVNKFCDEFSNALARDSSAKPEIDIEAERTRIAKIGEEERKKFWEEFGEEKPKISAEDAEKWFSITGVEKSEGVNHGMENPRQRFEAGHRDGES